MSPLPRLAYVKGFTMNEHHSMTPSMRGDTKDKSLRGYADPDVERQIIARIIDQTGPGSLQSDIALTMNQDEDRPNMRMVSPRHDLKLSQHRLRLRG